MKKTAGLTLIELMIALLISFIMIHTVTLVYFTAQKQFYQQTYLSELQEDIRGGIYLLKAEIKMAGYIGCGKLSQYFQPKPYKNYSITPQNKIQFHNHEILVRHASAYQGYLLQAMRSNNTLYVTLEPTFNAGDILLISNCLSGELFEVHAVFTEGNRQKITTSAPLSQRYESDAELSVFETNTFFIEKVSQNNENIAVLYQRDNHGNASELARGFNDMKVSFDFLDKNLLVELPAAENASNVKGVAISFSFPDARTLFSYTRLRDA